MEEGDGGRTSADPCAYIYVGAGERGVRKFECIFVNMVVIKVEKGIMYHA